MIYSIDFETRSRANLPDVGLDIYANDPTTEVLCIAYGTNPSDVAVYNAPKPDTNTVMAFSRFLKHVKDGGKIQAWNAMFEYAIWNCVCVPKYGWPPLKLEQVIDSMAIAAANNVPQSLDDAGTFMDSTHKKDAIGARLIQKLCKPNRKGEFENDPELLKQLFDYCAQDVRTEMAIVKLLRPLSEREQEIWELTQRINLRGVPVDPNELQNAVKAVGEAQASIDAECVSLTGFKPSERAKLLYWINQKIPHAPMPDLTAETVEKMLQCNIFPVIKRAL